MSVCNSSACKGRLRVVSTETIGDTKKQRLKCKACGSTYFRVAKRETYGEVTLVSRRGH